jgi:trk system potassium uptake protein TrkH
MVTNAKKPGIKWRRPAGLTESRLRNRRLAPAEVFVGSFFALIVLGTMGLKWLPGLYTGEPLGWTDAVFTATSAVCVTGLIVVDTATYFTTAGQALILSLIQLGGLGMLVLASVVIMALGGRPSFRAEVAAAGSRDAIPHIPARRLIIDVVRFTFVLEALGTIALYFLWAPRLGWREALWPAVFHSISAFCNAGFSTRTSNLVDFGQSPLTLLVFAMLICAGGLGFVTMEELRDLRVRTSRGHRRLSVHSKLVLSTTLLLILVGWVAFAIFEWRGVLADMGMTDKVANSLFMSVTPRTAGFNSIDYGQASDSTLLMTTILMTVGGSPGSTAGGIKTTTFALLGLLAWSRLRSHTTVTFGHRSIPNETIQRAVGLFVIATGATVMGVLALTLLSDYYGTEHSFLSLLFETSSAFNTVGLSMGISGALPTPSRWVLILLMFIGRTGPLAIAENSGWHTKMSLLVKLLVALTTWR